MGRKPTLAATGVALCLLLAACGGSGDELSKAAFVKKADAVCKEARRQGLKNEEDLASSVAKMLNSEADGIDALDGPSSDADQIEAIVDGAREAADEVEANEKNLAKAQPSAERAEKLAGDYGLEECLIS